jgi:hypothetical protein
VQVLALVEDALEQWIGVEYFAVGCLHCSSIVFMPSHLCSHDLKAHDDGCLTKLPRGSIFYPQMLFLAQILLHAHLRILPNLALALHRSFVSIAALTFILLV